MKRHIILIYLILFSLNIYSQNTNLCVFNKYNNVDTSLVSIVAIKPTNSGYLYVGDIDAVNGYSGIYLQHINSCGDILSTSILFGETCFSTIYFGGSLQRTIDNNYVVSFNKGTGIIDRDFILIKFSESGEVVWLREYVRQHNQNGANVIACTDGGFLLIGISQQYYTPTDVAPARVHVIKTDSHGEEVWEYIYPSNNVAPLYAEHTQDGGFIISGYQYNSATGFDMYALKIDAQGIVQWEQTYGTPLDDGGCLVLQKSDGDFFLLGLINGEPQVERNLYFAVLDKENGTVIFDKQHSKNMVYIPDTGVHLSEDGNIKVILNSWGPPPIWETLFTTISPEGDIVSEVSISSGLPGEDYMRDLEPTPDGGFVLAGFNYTYPESGWVVKLGPNGEYCGVAPCVDSLFVSNVAHHVAGGQGKPVIQAQMYPNPAQGSTTISYSLPPQLPFGVVELYDLQGQKVRYQVLPAGGSSPFTQTIDLSGLSAGVYVWRLAMSGGYERFEANGKIIVND